MQFQTFETHFALQSKDEAPQDRSSTPKNPQTQGGIQLLSDTEGVDFGSYLHAIYISVRDRWRAGMPPSVESGQQGRNTVQFRVQKDGTVPEDFLKLVFSSEKKDLDEASLQAVRKAAPFSHLPEAYSQPFIVLRLTFYYNSAPKK
jgi:TonB family protein